jgi:P-type E1-E2 ATPase
MWEEKVGKGIVAKAKDLNGLTREYQLSRLEKEVAEIHDQSLSAVALLEEGVQVVEILIQNSIRSDVPFLFKILKRDFDLWICSGDKKQPVEWIAHQLGVDESHAKYEQTPEQKLEFVKGLGRPALYIGDGANDGLVLAHSELGLAAFGAFDLSLKSAHGYFLKPRLKSLVDLIHIARETDRLLKRHFVFTILYNSLAMGLAITGHLSPLVAAILMPLSSVLILLSTVVSTSEMRRMRKESL